MGMNAGKMDLRISIEREAASAVNAFGTATQTFAEVHSCWAQLVTRNTQDALAGEVEAVAFRIRYVAGLQSSDRVRFDGKTYEVQEIAPWARGGILELRCTRMGAVS
ncbi:phage head closure protein [Rhodobacter capsulatus]|uniref:phage head closure protein n=1 Tax=Rhodobacter capsulatus TaxID=1061 RepID=UPI00402A31E9